MLERATTEMLHLAHPPLRTGWFDDADNLTAQLFGNVQIASAREKLELSLGVENVRKTLDPRLFAPDPSEDVLLHELAIITLRSCERSPMTIAEVREYARRLGVQGLHPCTERSDFSVALMLGMIMDGFSEGGKLLEKIDEKITVLIRDVPTEGEVFTGHVPGFKTTQQGLESRIATTTSRINHTRDRTRYTRRFLRPV